jgi:hypothetical protein
LVSVGQPSFEPVNFSFFCETEAWSVTFTKAGTYEYTDTFSQEATGRVVVR